MSRYAIANRVTGELATYGGRVLVHDNKSELEFLFPKSRIVSVSDGDLGQPVLPIMQHPAMASTRWPLRREDFVDAG